MDEYYLKRRQEGYNQSSPESLSPKAFLCNECSDRGYVRIEVDVGTPYFGQAIPCPICNIDLYGKWIHKHGVPPTMPDLKWR